MRFLSSTPKHSLTLCVLFLSFFSVLLPAFAQTTRPARPIGKIDTAAQFQNSDDRLKKTVSFNFWVGPTVHELVEYLSRDSDIYLKLPYTTDRSGDEGYNKLFVSLRGKTPTFAQMMDAVASLLSYQGAVWHWKQIPVDNNSFVYELQPSQALPKIVSELSNQIISEFEAQDRDMQDALQAKPQELSEKQKTNPNIAYLNTGNETTNQKNRYALQTFFQVLPQEKRLKVLRGGVEAVHIDTLPEAGKKFVAAMLASVPYKHPMKYLFFQTLPADAEGISPALILSLWGEQGSLSKSYLGGPIMDKKWNERLSALWQLENDTHDNSALDSQSLSTAKLSESLKEHYPPKSMVDFLHEISETAPVPFLVVLKPPRSSYEATFVSSTGVPMIESINGKTLRRILEELQSAPLNHLDHKWHDGVLLLRDTSIPFAPPLRHPAK